VFFIKYYYFDETVDDSWAQRVTDVTEMRYALKV
jgi:hypothetical protein